MNKSFTSGLRMRETETEGEIERQAGPEGPSGCCVGDREGLTGLDYRMRVSLAGGFGDGIG